jgi:nucleotide-binding universal stress UspA family protein
MFKTVLFPVNNSRESQQAAETVAQLVKFHASHTPGVKLVVLAVVEADATEGEAGESLQDSTQAAQLLDSAKKAFSQQGISCETLDRTGKPAFTICDVADEISADVIVMGCRGLGLTEEGAADSVTYRVLSLSPCPVLVVP